MSPSRNWRIAIARLTRGHTPGRAKMLAGYVLSGREASAEPLHQRHEIGEAGGDRAGVVNLDFVARRQPEHEERHRHAVIEPRLDPGAAVRRTPTALNDQVVAFDLYLHTAARQPFGDPGEPVAFL